MFLQISFNFLNKNVKRLQIANIKSYYLLCNQNEIVLQYCIKDYF